MKSHRGKNAPLIHEDSSRKTKSSLKPTKSTKIHQECPSTPPPLEMSMLSSTAISLSSLSALVIPPTLSLPSPTLSLPSPTPHPTLSLSQATDLIILPTIPPSPPTLPSSQCTSKKPQIIYRDPQSYDESSLTNVLLTTIIEYLFKFTEKTNDTGMLRKLAVDTHAAFSKGLMEAPGVHIIAITPRMAGQFMEYANYKRSVERQNYARFCCAIASTCRIGVEPVQGVLARAIDEWTRLCEAKGARESRKRTVRESDTQREEHGKERRIYVPILADLRRITNNGIAPLSSKVRPHSSIPTEVTYP